MEKQKMNVKDLVNVGIFTDIYFVLFYICGMTGLVPFMAVFYTPLLALIAGIPCVLFFTKTEKFGMVTIMGVLMGLIIFLMGYGYYGLILGICCGLVADLIMKAGKYKSWKMMVLGYAVFCEWAIGTQLPMFIMGDAYVEMYRSSQGDAYADALSALVKGYMVPVVIVVIAVCAVIGAYIGKAVLNKHFKRAGIA